MNFRLSRDGRSIYVRTSFCEEKLVGSIANSAAELRNALAQGTSLGAA